VTLNPGFDRSHVLLVNMNVHNAGVPPAARVSYYTRILDRLKSVPGAASVSQVWLTPFSGMEWNQGIELDGHQPSAGEEPLVYFNWITDGYFTTLRTPLLAGRTFNSGDTATSPRVAIVNETMARRFFAKTNPLGKYFRFPELGGAKRAFEIVGVVADSKYESLREATYPFAYVPLAQMDFTSGDEGLDLSSFIIRTSVNPTSLVSSVGEAIGAINKSASLQFSTLAVQVDDSLTAEHLLAMLSGFFGGLALLLTAIGLYGVMAYIVTQRTHEIGIRVALGARYSSILGLVMRDIALLLASGVAIGMVLAAWVTRFVQHLLWGLTANDAGTLILAAAVLAAVALLASYIPARRAMRVDPMVALRYE
jgi:putative ABC transport system permease protein